MPLPRRRHVSPETRERLSQLAKARWAKAKKAGKSRFVLQTLPAEDFPRLAKPAGDAARFSLPQKALQGPKAPEPLRLPHKRQ